MRRANKRMNGRMRELLAHGVPLKIVKQMTPAEQWQAVKEYRRLQNIRKLA